MRPRLTVETPQEPRHKRRALFRDTETAHEGARHIVHTVPHFRWSCWQQRETTHAALMTSLTCCSHSPFRRQKTSHSVSIYTGSYPAAVRVSTAQRRTVG